MVEAHLILPVTPSDSTSQTTGQPAGAATYDQIVEQWIPGYASLARLAVALLAASPLAGRQGARVLVAGCGTGAELLEARRQRPDWSLTALDADPAMLAEAQQRLAQRGLAEGIDWQCSRVEQLQAAEPYAGALAVLVLQSQPDDGSKLAFLAALARSLAPAAQLVLVDLMRPTPSPLEEQVTAAWKGFQAASGLPSGPGPSDPLGRGLHPIGEARLDSLVTAAGFLDPAPVFRALDVQGFLLQRAS